MYSPLPSLPPSPILIPLPPHFTTSSHRQSWSEECESEAIKQFSLSAAAKKSNSPISRFIGERGRGERERGPFHLPQIRIKKKKKNGQGSRSRHFEHAIPPKSGENPSLILVQSPLRFVDTGCTEDWPVGFQRSDLVRVGSNG